MSVLGKSQIYEKIQKKELIFSPALDKFQLGSHSVDLRLGFTFMVPKFWHVTKKGREAINIDYLDNKGKSNFDIVELEQGQRFDILPGEYVIFSTFESIKLPKNIMAVLYPRSSVNRRGLSVDLTGIIDAGYEGHLIIPVRNNTKSQTIRVYPGERFCQLVFEELSGPLSELKKNRYHGRYNNMDVVKGFLKEKSSTEINLIFKGDIKKLKDKFTLGL
ncbi:MAG: dCTP deaminase [bacterium]|nr:dCTP deaminase [bacterium]